MINLFALLLLVSVLLAFFAIVDEVITERYMSKKKWEVTFPKDLKLEELGWFMFLGQHVQIRYLKIGERVLAIDYVYEMEAFRKHSHFLFVEHSNAGRIAKRLRKGSIVKINGIMFRVEKVIARSEIRNVLEKATCDVSWEVKDGDQTLLYLAKKMKKI